MTLMVILVFTPIATSTTGWLVASSFWLVIVAAAAIGAVMIHRTEAVSSTGSRANIQPNYLHMYPCVLQILRCCTHSGLSAA